jgi:hypothetical protein
VPKRELDGAGGGGRGEEGVLVGIADLKGEGEGMMWGGGDGGGEGGERGGKVGVWGQGAVAGARKGWS